MALWRTRQLTVYLNNRCNMNCVYCYQGDYKKFDEELDFEFAKVGMDEFLGKQGYEKLRLYAVGEPTLSFRLMKDVTKYAKDRYPHITIELQTNMFCNETVAHWIGDNVDIVWISLDGPPDIQNRQRPASSGELSYNVIERNITILQKHDIVIGTRPTITTETVFRQREIVEHASELGIKAMYLHHAIEPQGMSRKSREESFYSINLLDFAKEYVKVYEFAKGLDIFVGSFLTANFDEENKYYCRACLPTPHLTLDGYLTSCDKGLYGSDPRFASFIYGKFNKDEKRIEFFSSKINQLRERHVDNMELCKECEVKYNCGGGCMGESNFLYNDIYRVIPEYCEAIRYLAKHIPRNKGLYQYLHP